MLRYIKITNDKIINYTIDQLLEDYPGAKIYDRTALPNELLLKKYNVYPLVTTPKPEGDLIEEGEPIFDGSEWIQTWVVKSLEKENISSQESDQITNDFNSDLNIFRPFLENKELFVDKEMQNYRYDICKSCDKFINLTKQCKECGCFMTLKTKLKISSCPLNKWDSQADK